MEIISYKLFYFSFLSVCLSIHPSTYLPTYLCFQVPFNNTEAEGDCCLPITCQESCGVFTGKPHLRREWSFPLLLPVEESGAIRCSGWFGSCDFVVDLSRHLEASPFYQWIQGPWTGHSGKEIIHWVTNRLHKIPGGHTGWLLTWAFKEWWRLNESVSSPPILHQATVSDALDEWVQSFQGSHGGWAWLVAMVENTERGEACALQVLDGARGPSTV